MAYSAGWRSANPARIAAGDGKVAERQRSRSEADTGRRIGLGFGLRLFFGHENRERFSCCAGPSMGTSFGLEFGTRASSAIRRIAGLFAQRLCRSGEWATGRSRQKKVSLLRFIAPPGLRVGPLAHPRSAQLEPDRIGRGWCPGLGLYSQTRANSAIPRGIAVLGEGDASAARRGRIDYAFAVHGTAGLVAQRRSPSGG